MMKSLLKTVCGTIIGMAWSGMVLAHPGHDHSHWSAGILHLLFIASLIGVAVAACYAIYVSRCHKHAEKIKK